MSNKIRKKIVFHGRVQGVGFRYHAANAARALGLTGFVKNEYDGTVHMEIQGTEAEIDMLIQTLNNDRYISIEDMDVQKIRLEEGERSFKVAY
ncbi:MAG: acylphosphatase [Lachnospiraceae bacterium]|nr:acylphosphatase [Lachnospiraceae bacterium]